MTQSLDSSDDLASRCQHGVWAADHCYQCDLASRSKADRCAQTVAIPISAGKRIADEFGYDQVVIVARKVGGNEHVTTYGRDKAHCTVAARMGNFFKHKLMGWPENAADNHGAPEPDKKEGPKGIGDQSADRGTTCAPTGDAVDEIMALAYAAAQENADYWRGRTGCDDNWVRSKSYAALRAAIEALGAPSLSSGEKHA